MDQVHPNPEGMNWLVIEVRRVVKTVKPVQIQLTKMNWLVMA